MWCACVQEKDILIFRFDSSLHFANRLFFEDKLTEQFQRRARSSSIGAFMGAHKAPIKRP